MAHAFQSLRQENSLGETHPPRHLLIKFWERLPWRDARPGIAALLGNRNLFPDELDVMIAVRVAQSTAE